MGSYKAGQPKPAKSGRKKGTPNRRSFLLRDALEDLGIDPIEKIVALIPKVPPGRQLDAWLSILAFAYPKPSPVSPISLNETQERRRDDLDEMTPDEKLKEIDRIQQVIKELRAAGICPDDANIEKFENSKAS